jgi:hypothetical protein
MAVTLEEFIKDFTLEERAKLAARTARSIHAVAAAVRRNRRQTADNASYTAAYCRQPPALPPGPDLRYGMGLPALA